MKDMFLFIIFKMNAINLTFTHYFFTCFYLKHGAIILSQISGDLRFILFVYNSTLDGTISVIHAALQFNLPLQYMGSLCKSHGGNCTIEFVLRD